MDCFEEKLSTPSIGSVLPGSLEPVYRIISWLKSHRNLHFPKNTQSLCKHDHPQSKPCRGNGNDKFKRRHQYQGSTFRVASLFSMSLIHDKEF
jgi:hypothetical protein